MLRPCPGGLALVAKLPVPQSLEALQVALLLFVGSSAALVVSTRSPARQVVVLSVYGLLLALLYLVVQASDVSLSELVVGAIVLPMPLLTAIAETKRDAK